MKAMMLCSYATYAKLKDNWSYSIKTYGFSSPIELNADMYVELDDVGYLLVNNVYIGKYDLKGSDDRSDSDILQ